MEFFFILISIAIFGYLTITIVEFILGFNLLKNLSSQTCLPKDNLPSVSIILSALNEENHLEKSLLSLLNLDYPNFEIIAVNDRSTDKTADIMERLQQSHSQLRVYHIKQLPEGWFGKNHALNYAAQHATGEWLLFTDADVLMKKEALIKAMSYVKQNKLNHLTIYERHLHQNFWLKILLLGHYITYSMVMKPWRIRYSWSKKSLGHGAFNLVEKQIYQKCGGHASISLECLDDLKLGELLKSKGFHQDIVDGKDYIEREWYSSVKDMIAGMKKNCFAYYDYRIIPIIRDLIFSIIFFVFPFVAVMNFTGSLRWINILNICLTLFISMYVAKQFRLKIPYAIFYLLGISMLIYTVWNSVFSTYRNNGVIWRGTHYSLQKLKRNIQNGRGY